jgi:nitrite reductase/ring-hydroxylating ferredoxin subunit
MGELMRRYWIPAALSWEVPEPDSPPITIKLLGEELVAFRQTDGRVGVVGARCAHRRAHLFWGRNEENGIRCVYHGWKFDCDGICVDMPSEPEESNFKDKVRIPAYPTYEIGGVVWCYMGPADKKPAAPLFAWTQVAPTHRSMSKVWEQCNWLQALEGGIDNVHSTFLHSGRPPGQQFDPSSPRNRGRNVSKAPVIEVVPTDFGFTYGSILDMGAEGTNFVRGYQWVLPFHSFLPGGESGGNGGHMWVPMDDENTMVYNRSARLVDVIETDESIERTGRTRNREYETAGAVPESPEMEIWFRDARRPVGMGNAFGTDVDVNNNFRSMRNMDNKYLIDRQVQKTETYTGIEGTNCQDRAVQESMGPIADRTLERLGTTDRAIIHARRTLLKAIRTVQDGGEPPGVAPTYYGLRAYETVLPKGVYWYEAIKASFKLAEKTPEHAEGS